MKLPKEETVEAYTKLLNERGRRITLHRDHIRRLSSPQVAASIPRIRRNLYRLERNHAFVHESQAKYF